MTADPHFGFIVAAYGVGFVVIAGMIFAILRDYFTLKRALSRFPQRGERDDRTKP
ncbi:heme exporter protein CcmD [Methylocella tundrae]|uniref:Heme exporter protein D n=1 Tax=Methylocella tundrae TaxID=227605 RepID=A0A4U8YZI2_METTU|nr:heme exporter protein CcmD [Methylocella tundrae]WPP06089.1 heme exporter protein CcmD [Methylocella tundrae]VFU08693.1 Heme exporter protein D [Methylocella tundrae]